MKWGNRFHNIDWYRINYFKTQSQDSTGTETVKAYGAESAETPLHHLDIQRRSLLPNDVEIDILYRGTCHSDFHSVHNDWGGTTYPIVSGYETVGRVTGIGSDVTKFRVGDLAGIGCIVDSCGHYEHCHKDEEQYCDEGWTAVFNPPDKYLGRQAYSGFSQAIMADANYVLELLGTIDLAVSAPILCAGITVYSSLKHWGADPGKKVGIVGIGGLDRMVIRVVKAMGAHVTVLTTSPSKMDIARELGADEAVLSIDPRQMEYQTRSDMILDAVSARHDVNMYLNALKVDGSLALASLLNQPFEVDIFNIANGRKSFSGSNIGGIAETQKVIDFCTECHITAQTELIGIDQINEAFRRLEKNDVKYRFVIDMKAKKVSPNTGNVM